MRLRIDGERCGQRFGRMYDARIETDYGVVFVLCET